MRSLCVSHALAPATHMRWRQPHTPTVPLSQPLTRVGVRGVTDVLTEVVSLRYESMSLSPTRTCLAGLALRYEPDGAKKSNQDSFVSIAQFGDASISGLFS